MPFLTPRSANENLVVFQDYLRAVPIGNSPPVSIRARDLDKNFTQTTVIPDPNLDEDDRTYEVRYEAEGTVLEIRALPKGINNGDLLYWNPAAGGTGQWVVLTAPQSNQLKVLGILNGALQWVDTQDC